MKPVIVTTQHRGVFFGYVPDDQDLTAESAVVEQCSMAIYWERSKTEGMKVGGALGLAEKGPQPGSRLSGVAPEIGLRSITSMIRCTDEAEGVWKNALGL